MAMGTQQSIRVRGLLRLAPLVLLVGCQGSGESGAQLQPPDETRFTPVVLVQGVDLDEPMSFEVLKDGRVFWIERYGRLKLYTPGNNTVELIAAIPVNTKYTSAEGRVTEAEEGLVGLTVHPDFERKPWVYLLYADPAEPKHVLARWEFRDNKLDEATKQVVLEYPVQRETCCHTGGGMTWDKSGNLYITVGNNTGNVAGAQTDERPNRSSWDDQRGASSTNDLRGKILRIHPVDDGSYTIPKGNLFPEGTPNTRAEIYAMGTRNAWRPSLDSKTGWLYWGEVGPDANEDTVIGPRGYDEQNQARGPGYFGWPYFVGENHAYPYTDYATGQSRGFKDPAKPINTSPNNTGLKELPAAQPAFISYPYGASERFPEVGAGARSATGGPVYRQADFNGAKRPFPVYYEGKWLMTDLSRGWIMEVTMDEKGDYQSMKRFLPSYRPIEPIDMKFGPDGDLYVLEYGSIWFKDSQDDKLVRIEYNAGNRKPVVAAAADKAGGKVPFAVKLSAAGTSDPDGDALNYQWTVSKGSGSVSTYDGESPTATLTEAGVYTVKLTATDAHGAANSQELSLVAGNDSPVVELNLQGNSQFYFAGVPIGYSADVTDTEDGSVKGGQIKPAQVAMSIDYVSQGLAYAEARPGYQSAAVASRFAVAQSLMQSLDCNTCHQLEVRSAGPSYKEIADKYRGDARALALLAGRVRNGSTGIWGEVAMAAHPTLSLNDAELLVRHILATGQQNQPALPLSGSYAMALPAGDAGRGTLIVRAAYADQGAGSSPSITSERSVSLRAPRMLAVDAQLQSNTAVIQSANGADGFKVLSRHGGHIGFSQLDLTGVNRLELAVDASVREGSVGGLLEVRLDSPAGELLGQVQVSRRDPMAGMSGPPNDINVAGAQGVNGMAPAAGTGPQGMSPQGMAGQGAGAQAGFSFADMAARMRAPPTTIAFSKPVAGLHDIYLVFKNDQARAADPVAGLTMLTLKHASQQ